MFRKMIPAAAALAVAAVALAGPAQAAESPVQKPAASATAGKTSGKTSGKESVSAKDAKALCLRTGRADAALASKAAPHSGTKAESPAALRARAAKLKKGDPARAALLKRAKARQAELASLDKQRARLAATLRSCAAEGHPTS